MEELKKSLIYQKISNDVNNFVQKKLSGYSCKCFEHKIIHDPIWGSTEYSEWEMQIIDSPLIQRLRNISQVGLAVLTYPAARHSRFEHTLGVAAATKRIVDRININSQDEKFHIDEPIKDKLVLAAIMHDVGHCFYSHLSQSIYGKLKDFAELRREIKKIYDKKPQPHEILSLIIVNSDAFKRFFSTTSYAHKGNLDKLLEDVGKIIIGVNIVNNKKIESYQTSIINGPFDVDKLDYIKRDSHTAGLALDFDIERLFTKIKVHVMPANNEMVENRLVIPASGVTAIEELTFCRIMLFSYIYYHQKVLITENMIQDYIQALVNLDLIKSFADFLTIDEATLLELSKEQKDAKPFPADGNISLEQLANNIRNRTLPKRCLEVSQNIKGKNITRLEQQKKTKLKTLLSEIRENKNYSLENFDEDIHKMIPYYTRSDKRYIANYVSEFEGKTTFDEILKIRKAIYKQLIKVYKKNKEHVDFDVFDIYFVFPPIVSYGTPGEKTVLGRNGNLMAIDDFVKLQQWASSFNAYKWRGYVYVTEKINRKYALEACRTVIFKNQVSLEDLKSFLKI